ELKIAEAIAKVPMVISTSDRVDETAFYADYLATGSNGFEAWGDSHPFPGVYSIRQPTIRPLYTTCAFEESLIVWFGKHLVPVLGKYLVAPPAPAVNRPGDAPTADAGSWYRYLRDHWRAEVYPQANAFAGFNEFWESVLRKGVFLVDTPPKNTIRFNQSAVLDALPGTLPEAKEAASGLAGKELHLFATIALGDGDMANDGHLQELPDPITKNTWGSYVLVSPKTFKEQGLKIGD